MRRMQPRLTTWERAMLVAMVLTPTDARATAAALAELSAEVARLRAKVESL